MTMIYEIMRALYLALPIYFANMAPVIVKNHFTKLAKPIDLGMEFGGKPLLGKNKTFRGLIFGVLFGIVVALLQFIVYRFEIFRNLSIFEYTLTNAILLGGLMGFGAIFGDMTESFLKRRIGIESGKPWIPFDQIDFVIGGLLFSFIMFIPSLSYVLIIIVFSPLAHIAVNHIAFYLKIRKEKW